jgi:hypothetical protein
MNATASPPGDVFSHELPFGLTEAQGGYTRKRLRAPRALQIKCLAGDETQVLASAPVATKCLKA